MPKTNVNSTVGSLVENLNNYKTKLRFSMKNFCTEVQQCADTITSEIMVHLKPFINQARNNDPDFRIVLTPEIQVRATDVAPSYEVTVDITWYLFFVNNNRAFPMDEIWLYKNIEEARPWEIVSDCFLALLKEYKLNGTIQDLPSAQKVGTILEHKRFKDNIARDKEKI